MKDTIEDKRILNKYVLHYRTSNGIIDGWRIIRVIKIHKDGRLTYKILKSYKVGKIGTPHDGKLHTAWLASHSKRDDDYYWSYKILSRDEVIMEML